MSKHAVDTVALNALITAFQQSSDLSAKEVHKLITDVASTAVAVTIQQPEPVLEATSLDNSEVVIELDNSNS